MTPPFASEFKDRARALRAAGRTYQAIADELGMSQTCAWEKCLGTPRGRCWTSRLTEDDVRDIRALVAAGALQTEVARAGRR